MLISSLMLMRTLPPLFAVLGMLLACSLDSAPSRSN